jgi:deoxyinosine 3'endonuclease (endonuclease V)
MKLQEKDVLAQPQDDLLETWKEEAERLKKLICLSDATELAKIAFIGGLDLSFVEDDASLACAALVVSTYPDCKVNSEEDAHKILTV